MALILLAAVAVVGILSTPLTLWMLTRRDEAAIVALFEGNQYALDRLLTHAAETQAPGEPAALTKAKLATAERDLQTKVEIARLRAAQAFDPMES